MADAPAERVEQSCPLCGLGARCMVAPGDGGNTVDVQCLRCGEYEITRWAIRKLTNEYALLREVLERAVRQLGPRERLRVEKTPAGEGREPIRAVVLSAGSGA